MEISRYDHLVTYDGLPTKKKLEILTIERGLPKSLHSFINEMKQQYTIEIVHQRCKPLFHHEYALARLKDEGYKLAVCSNSIKNTVSLMMEKAALQGYLELFLSNQDVTMSKPDPEIYLTAMSRLGLQPDECMVVEDNEHGIIAGRASGAHVMIVENVYDVNYQNIRNNIKKVESEQIS